MHKFNVCPLAVVVAVVDGFFVGKFRFSGPPWAVMAGIGPAFPVKTNPIVRK